MNAQILLVGRLELMRQSAHALLAQDAYIITIEPDGLRSIERQRQEHFDLLVVDLELPPFDRGPMLASLWERIKTPVLVLTSHADANDAIAALEVGADDYLKKPFDPVELAARARALLRRASWMPRPHDGSGQLGIGDVTIDCDTYQVWRSGREICLSVTEFNLLLTLMRNAGQVLTRQRLVEGAWPYRFLGNSRLVDMTIARLRHKLEDDPKHPKYVRTVRGLGYRFEIERQGMEADAPGFLTT